MFIIVALIGPLVSVLGYTEASSGICTTPFKTNSVTVDRVSKRGETMWSTLVLGTALMPFWDWHGRLLRNWLCLVPTVWRANLRGCDVTLSSTEQKHCQGVSNGYDTTAGIRMQMPGDATWSVIPAVADGL